MQDEPGGLLCDAYLLGELQAADALAGRHEQIHGIDPFVQRDVRPLEDRAGPNGEIFFALVAAVVPALASSDAFADATDGALWAVRPEPRADSASGNSLKSWKVLMVVLSFMQAPIWPTRKMPNSR